MCRNIKVLTSTSPTHTDIEAASIQYVRKISGINSKSKLNSIEFENAIREITNSTEKLLKSIHEKS